MALEKPVSVHVQSHYIESPARKEATVIPVNETMLIIFLHFRNKKTIYYSCGIGRADFEAK